MIATKTVEVKNKLEDVFTEKPSKIGLQVLKNNRCIGYIVNIDSNCKFSIIDYISNAYSWDSKEFKQNVDALLERSKIAVLIQTNHLGTVSFLQENYEVYSLVRLPIGYSQGYQYHVTLRNTLSNADNLEYARKIKNPSIQQVNSIDNEIKKLFIAKRRKSDLIPDILEIVEKYNTNDDE